ncbi:MAG: S16 family serine protease [Acidimicrobiales bacterium]
MSEPDGTRTTVDRPEPARRARRWPAVVALVVAVLVVAGVVSAHVDLGDYVLTPGHAEPVGPLVEVPAARAHHVVGKVLLTDVDVAQVTALTYLYDELRSDAQVLPETTVLGPATPPSELVAQGYLEMAQSQDAARAAALTRLGYGVHEHNAGTLVFSVMAGSPAARILRVGEIVTAVDGTATPDVCAFSRALARHGAGARVTLEIERSTVTSHAVIEPGPTKVEHATLVRWPASVSRPGPTPSCPGAGRAHEGFLGVGAETQEDFRFPFPVSVRTTAIGGPSAGLAMTLGILDTLSGGHLTGGRAVAATGTITPAGAVGEVGGIPQKTVAVERAGASVFFVPAAQVATAREKATPGLKVLGVRSITGVLRALHRLGGTVPAPRRGEDSPR